MPGPSNYALGIRKIRFVDGGSCDGARPAGERRRDELSVPPWSARQRTLRCRSSFMRRIRGSQTPCRAAIAATDDQGDARQPGLRASTRGVGPRAAAADNRGPVGGGGRGVYDGLPRAGLTRKTRLDRAAVAGRRAGAQFVRRMESSSF